MKGICLAEPESGQTPEQVVVVPTNSPVILSEHPEVVLRFAVDDNRVERMVNESILKLTSAPNLAIAWTRLGITPKDVVGIKISTAGGPLLSTHKAILRAICIGLRACGVPTNHIIIWDKYGPGMATAGFAPVPATDEQVAIGSVFPGSGYDPDQVYRSELAGSLIWGDSEFVGVGDSELLGPRNNDSFNGVRLNDGDRLSTSQRSNVSHYANLVSRICTKIINVPVLTDNPSVGLQGCLANLALGSVDNNRRFQGPPTLGDPAIAEILSAPFFRKKVVLNVLDALVMQCAGGPGFDPQFCHPLGAIYMSRDAVAIDTLALPRVEAARRRDRVDPIGSNASHIHSCTLPRLGTDDLHRIQLIRL